VGPDAYAAFTAALVDRLAPDDRVLGIVALGSMAGRDHLPDQWSDHDFFVIVRTGEAETFRRDLWWLPAHETVVLALRETAHGLKVLYADGHLLEFAVFEPDDVHLAKAGRSRVLLDRGGIAEAIETISGAIRPRPDSVDVDWQIGMAATNVLVGIGRHARGERLSAHQFVTGHAIGHLLQALVVVPASRNDLLDGLDARRRFEQVHPQLGAEIDGLLARTLPEIALGLLAIARRELGAQLSPATLAAISVVEDRCRTNEAPAG
jgi:hypothetical protein